MTTPPPALARGLLVGLALLLGVVGLATVDTWQWTTTSLLHQFTALLLLAGAVAWCSLTLAARPHGPRSAPRAWALVAGTLLLTSCFILAAGRRQFAGYDMSILIEAGWRMLQGQRPITDFPCSLPPSYLWGIQCAFRLGGVSWSSILWFTTIISAVSLVWLFLLLRSLPELRPFALLLATALIAQTFLVTDFWYYNQWAAIVVVLVALSAAAAAQRPTSWPIGCSLACALAALALAKPNSWMVGASLLPLLTTRRRLATLLLASTAALVLVVLLAALEHYDLVAMLRMYGELAKSRGNPLTSDAFRDAGTKVRHFTEATVLIYLLPLLLVLLLRPKGASPPARAVWPLLWASGCAMVAGVMAAWTNMELKVSDLAPECVGAACATLALVGRRPSPSPRAAPDADPGTGPMDGRTFACLWLCLTVLLVAAAGGVVNGWTRTRVYSTGKGFYERAPLHSLRGPPAMRGIRCGPQLQETVDQLQDLISHHAGARFFFGGRIDFAYAAWQLPSPHGLPIWWAPGTAYPLSQQHELRQRFQQADFDLIVFHKHDMPFQEQETKALEQRYRCDDDTYSALTVYRRRLPVATASSPTGSQPQLRQ